MACIPMVLPWVSSKSGVSFILVLAANKITAKLNDSALF